MAKKTNYEEGRCPKCSGELEYGSGEPDGGSFTYEVYCQECDFEGKEVYDMTFNCLIDDEGEIYTN